MICYLKYYIDSAVFFMTIVLDATWKVAFQNEQNKYWDRII